MKHRTVWYLTPAVVGTLLCLSPQFALGQGQGQGQGQNQGQMQSQMEQGQQQGQQGEFEGENVDTGAAALDTGSQTGEADEMSEVGEHGQVGEVGEVGELSVEQNVEEGADLQEVAEVQTGEVNVSNSHLAQSMTRRLRASAAVRTAVVSSELRGRTAGAAAPKL